MKSASTSSQALHTSTPTRFTTSPTSASQSGRPPKLELGLLAHPLTPVPATQTSSLLSSSTMASPISTTLAQRSSLLPMAHLRQTRAMLPLSAFGALAILPILTASSSKKRDCCLMHKVAADLPSMAGTAVMTMVTSTAS